MNGADYNAVDGFGRTSMYIAAEAGHEKAVLVHLSNAYGKTILSLPMIETGMKTVKTIMKLCYCSKFIKFLFFYSASYI